MWWLHFSQYWGKKCCSITMFTPAAVLAKSTSQTTTWRCSESFWADTWQAAEIKSKGYLPLLHIWNNSFLWVSLVAAYQCLQMLLQEHREHKPHVPIWSHTQIEGRTDMKAQKITHMVMEEKRKKLQLNFTTWWFRSVSVWGVVLGWVVSCWVVLGWVVSCRVVLNWVPTTWRGHGC